MTLLVYQQIKKILINQAKKNLFFLDDEKII